jgi:AcrR family transcriptional regulator
MNMTVQSNFDSVATEALSGHQRRRLETRRALLQAARQLFLAQGQTVSIDAITAAAGVAKGSFYNHFSSREALFEHILETVLQALMEKCHRFSSDIEDPLAFLEARTRFTFRTLLEDPDSCKLLLLSGPALPGGAVDRGLHATLFAEIKAGVNAGALRQIDADLLYAAYFGVVTETIGHLLNMDAPPDPEQGAAVVTQLCFAVLGLKPGT